MLAHIDGADDLQHIAELLAVFRVGGREHRSAHLRIADALTSRRPGDVISALAGGRPPEPLVGCLARIGHKALNDPTLYADLIGICRDDPRRAGIFAMGGGRITEDAITTLLVADPIMLDPAIIAKIDTAADAKALSACVNVIRRTCSGVTDDMIRQSLADIDGELVIDRWCDRFLLRHLDKLAAPGPFAENNTDFETLTTGRQIASTGRQFRNCVATHIRLVAAGRAVYCTARQRRIIVECRRMSTAPHWLVAEAFGPQNARLTVEDWLWLSYALTERGIPFMAAADQDGERAVEAGHNFYVAYEPLAMSALNMR